MTLRKALLTLLLALGVAGCAGEGPDYRVRQVLDRGDGDIELVLAKSWMKWSWFSGEQRREHSYVARARVESERLALAPATLLYKGHWDEFSTFAPLTNAGRWLRTTTDADTVTLVTREPRRRPRVFARIPAPQGDEPRASTARALTRSGRYLLLVDEQEVRRIDTVTGEIFESSRRSPLLQLRRTLYAHLGSPGRWWLSDDLRYVIVAPSVWQYSNGVMATVESTPLRLFDLDVNFQTQGLIYDGQTGSFATFALAIGLPDGKKGYLTEISDAESVGGEVQLLYDAGGYGATKTLAILTPQLDGRHRADVHFRHNNPPVDFDWSIGSKRVCLLEAEPGERPPYRLHVWNTDTGLLSAFTFTAADVERSIHAAR